MMNDTANKQYLKPIKGKTITSPMLRLLITALLSGTAASSQADTIFGIYAGIAHWSSEYTGDFSAEGDDIDLDNDLSFKKDDANILYVAIEHPIPMLPNAKLKQSDIDINETTTLTRSVSYGDQTYAADERIATHFDLNHMDATAYYEVLDNWVSLDLGLTIRQFDGFIEVSSETQNDKEERIDVDEVVPMLYGMAQFDLPFSGVYAGAEVNWLSISGNSLSDATVKLGYQSDYLFGIEMGYRALNITLDDVNDLDTDINIGGFYTALVFHL